MQTILANWFFIIYSKSTEFIVYKGLAHYNIALKTEVQQAWINSQALRSSRSLRT